MTNNELWRELFNRRHHDLKAWAPPCHWYGINRLWLDELPDLEFLGNMVRRATGWRLHPVHNCHAMSHREYFHNLASAVFPVNSQLRPADQQEWTEHPDLFHDCVGHLPYLLDDEYVSTLLTFGAAASKTDVDKLAQLYWNTMEFGILGDNASARILGASPLSSHGECRNLLKSEWRPFSLQAALEKPIKESGFQDWYFKIRDLAQVRDAVWELVG